MIVGGLVVVDIVFLIPTTASSNSRLRREYEEIEGDEVSVLDSYYFSLASSMFLM